MIVIIKIIDSQLSMVNSTLVVTLYINPTTGNDTNTGSRLSPFKSLTRALKVTKISTIIHLEPGTYSTASGEVFPLIIPEGATVIGKEANKGVGIVISGSGEYQSPSFGRQNITLLLLDNASLLGVTVTNPSAKGTGIWIESAVPTLANNTLSDCGREGVFSTGNAKPAILDNIFVQNAASGLVMAGHSQGEVLRNLFERNSLGIVISDFAKPTIANNKLLENHTAIALSRNAQPILRQNLIAQSTQGGLLINGNAIPDLGNIQDSADNIFRDNSEFDLYNATKENLVSVGNQLNSSLVKGLVEFIPIKKVVVDTSFPEAPTEPSSEKLLAPVQLDAHWAEPFIQALVSMNLTHCFADGSYQPDKPMTRAQYASLVAIAFNPFPKISAPDFTDVPKDFWAYNAIQIAASGGFVGGFSDRTFRPDQNVQRLQVIVSLVNGLGLPPTGSDILEVYSDRHTIPEYARRAVATATQQKIIVNYPDPKLLAPLRLATRAEVAAMVYQALVAIGRTSAIKSVYVGLHSRTSQVE
jgi:parallel beta-helix repeat protein